MDFSLSQHQHDLADRVASDAGNGFTLADVVHCRLSVVDFDHREDAARAHAEVHPAFAPPLVDEGILVEAETTAERMRP